MDLHENLENLESETFFVDFFVEISVSAPLELEGGKKSGSSTHPSFFSGVLCMNAIVQGSSLIQRPNIDEYDRNRRLVYAYISLFYMHAYHEVSVRDEELVECGDQELELTTFVLSV